MESELFKSLFERISDNSIFNNELLEEIISAYNEEKITNEELNKLLNQIKILENDQDEDIYKYINADLEKIDEENLRPLITECKELVKNKKYPEALKIIAQEEEKIISLVDTYYEQFENNEINLLVRGSLLTDNIADEFFTDPIAPTVFLPKIYYEYLKCLCDVYLYMEDRVVYEDYFNLLLILNPADIRLLHQKIKEVDFKIYHDYESALETIKNASVVIHSIYDMKMNFILAGYAYHKLDQKTKAAVCYSHAKNIYLEDFDFEGELAKLGIEDTYENLLPCKENDSKYISNYLSKLGFYPFYNPDIVKIFYYVKKQLENQKNYLSNPLYRYVVEQILRVNDDKEALVSLQRVKNHNEKN